MALSKTALFLTLLPAVRNAAKDAMTLYNKGLDPNDKETDIEIGTLPFPKIKISVDCSKSGSPISNTAVQGDKSVDAEKAAELFGLVFAYNVVPVLINQFTDYIKSADVIVPPGQAVATTGTAAAQAGATTSPSSPATIL